MLRELHITNIAIIDEMRLRFGPGLNVLTGETGAGKSILMHALALLCGARSGTDLIRTNAEEATIEGLFELGGETALLEEVGVPAEDDLLIRRVLSRSGKSRVHVNGGPATVALLARLGDRLVHVYGQLDQARLLDPDSHLDFVDRFGQLLELRGRMEAAHGELAEARLRLQELERSCREIQQRRGLLEFQAEELARAHPLPDEEEQLRRERDVERSAVQLQQTCRAADEALYSGEAATTEILDRIAHQLREAARIDPGLGGTADLVETARVQLDEAAGQLRGYADRLHFDPERLEQIDDRLALLGRLARKYEVPSSQLAQTLEGIRAQLAGLESLGTDRAAAERAVEEKLRAAQEIAGELSARRRRVGQSLQKEMERELGTLGMKGAVLRVVQNALGDADDLRPSGSDTVEFFLSANPGEEPRPLARIASGGELSRVMLALKALTAGVMETPILIFDEVDAGIGGHVADAVAQRLRRLSQSHQILCITHLPQIAAYADQHFALAKRVAGKRTVVEARELAADDRVAEISRMLGDNVAPREARRYAERLIEQSQQAGRPSTPGGARGS